MTKNGPYIFPTVNVTKIEKINSTLLQIHIPSFPTGEGSVIKVTIWLVKPIGNTHYVLYATYDQGSIKIIIPRPLNWSDAFINFWNTFWIPIFLIASGITTLCGFIIYRYIIRRRESMRQIAEISRVISKSNRAYESVSEILYDILTVREDLSKDPLSINWLFMLARWQNTEGKMRLQLFKNNIIDYIDVNNFLEKMQTHSKKANESGGFPAYYGAKPGDTDAKTRRDDLEKINKEILDGCGHYLFDIDWTKYK